MVFKFFAVILVYFCALSSGLYIITETLPREDVEPNSQGETYKLDTTDCMNMNRLFGFWPYHASCWNDVVTPGIVLLLYDIRGCSRVMLCLVLCVLQECFRSVSVLVKKFGLLAMLLLVFSTTGISILLCALALHQSHIINFLYSSIITSTEESIAIYNTTCEIEEVTDKLEPHPSTRGERAPYFLFNVYRYQKEDAVFTCNHAVQSVEGHAPIIMSTGWLKNGVPLIPNDRIHERGIILAINDIQQINRTLFPVAQTYHVVVSLTIELIQDDDYGIYTCSPDIVFRIPVSANVRRLEECLEWHHKPRPFMKSEDSHCSENFTSNKSSSPVKLIHLVTYTGMKNFMDFSLIPYQEQTLRRELNPGSILSECWRYITVAEETDLDFDVTLYDKDHVESNCCSKVLFVYESLKGVSFYGGFSVSHFDHFSQSVFAVVRVQCLCKSSFGMRRFVIIRNYFNQTLGTTVQMEVQFPVKLFLTPKLPRLNLSANISSECWGKDSPPPLCDIVLELLLDTFYKAENFITGYSSIYVVTYSLLYLTSIYIVCRWVVPTFFMNGVFFCALFRSTVRLKPANPRGEANSNSEWDEAEHYDVYMSYDEEEQYDLMVSYLVKEVLTGWGLKVFHFSTDILPGHPQHLEMMNAIENSMRFIIIASKGYVHSTDKTEEFGIMQQCIMSQTTSPKDRILIINLEATKLRFFKGLPDIFIPKNVKVIKSLDKKTIKFLKIWERSTRPGSGNSSGVIWKSSRKRGDRVSYRVLEIDKCKFLFSCTWAVPYLLIFTVPDVIEFCLAYIH